MYFVAMTTYYNNLFRSFIPLDKAIKQPKAVSVDRPANSSYVYALHTTSAVKMAILKSDKFIARFLRATKNTVNISTSQGCLFLG
jgi:hypothetical protein